MLRQYVDFARTCCTLLLMMLLISIAMSCRTTAGSRDERGAGFSRAHDPAVLPSAEANLTPALLQGPTQVPAGFRTGSQRPAHMQAALLVPGDVLAALVAYKRLTASWPSGLGDLTALGLLPFRPLAEDGSMIEFVEQASLTSGLAPAPPVIAFEFLSDQVQFCFREGTSQAGVQVITQDQVQHEIARLSQIVHNPTGAHLSTGQQLIAGLTPEACVLYAWLKQFRLRVFRFVQLNGCVPANIDDLCRALGQQLVWHPASPCDATALGQAEFTWRVDQTSGIVENQFRFAGRPPQAWRDWYVWDARSGRITEKGSVQPAHRLLDTVAPQICWPATLGEHFHPRPLESIPTPRNITSDSSRAAE